jgi:hypothetical protein
MVSSAFKDTINTLYKNNTIVWEQLDKKKDLPLGQVFLGIGAWRCATLTWGSPTLPSPLIRFTSEFEMGSGGSVSLWSPSKTGKVFTYRFN